MTSEAFLRHATPADLQDLHAMLCLPEVYRYLADDAPPPEAAAREWIELGIAERASGLGVWMLVDAGSSPMGCVRLTAAEQPPGRAELLYLLHPRAWGRGLATRMSFSVMQHALRVGAVDQILAGADEPNTASVAVMRRLGMRFHRAVRYPMGPGVEYSFRRGDALPNPLPRSIELRAAPDREEPS